MLNKIQKELKAPKSQFNSFGKYHYRNCEDILEAVKPLLGEDILTLTDEIVQVGDRYYVKATATLHEGANDVIVSAYAREALDKKGMDEAQITGAASSYARKYALNGLFLIDDTKDADTDEKPKEPKEDVIGVQKKRIQTLCDEKCLVPLLGGDDYKKYVLENTGLALEAGNYSTIIERLEALK